MGDIPPSEALKRVSKRLTACNNHLTNALLLPGQQRELLSTAVISLKSIWNIFNNMDRRDPQIASWFQDVTEHSKADPLLKFFKTVRDLDLKEGVDGIRGVSVSMRPGASFASSPDGFTFTWKEPDGNQQLVRVPRPPNAVSSFMGDPAGGGMGFMVRQPDGAIEKQYVVVPPACVQIDLFYPEAPMEHCGSVLHSNEASYLVSQYHSYWMRSCAKLRTLIHAG